MWAEVTAAKLRPGSLISNCTAGFLFVDPVKQRYYLGTAGHCTDSADGSTQDGVGTRVTLFDAETDDALGEIGTVVFDSDGPRSTAGNGLDGEGAGSVDFTLAELDPGVNLIAHPQVLSLQGPTGYQACSELKSGDTVGFYGNGLGYKESRLYSRSGAVVRCNPYSPIAEIAIPINFGDSGGPALNLFNGKAIGHASSGLAADMNAIAMDYVFAELAKAGFGNVALATIDGGYVKPQ